MNEEEKRAALRERMAAYRLAHPDRIREATARYRAAHAERIAASKALYWSTHRDELRARHRATYAAAPEKGRAYARSYRERHPEKKQAWNAANAERLAKDAARKYAERPEGRRELSHQRRARLKGVLVEKVDLSLLVARDRGKCGICGKAVPAELRSVDHILPLSKGGVHSLANTRLTHVQCNVRRNNRGVAQLRMFG